MAKPRSKPRQLSLDDARKPSGIGGWRPHAGRKKGRKTVPHDKRPTFAAWVVHHVTWRLVAGLSSLRRDSRMTVIRAAIKLSHSDTFRVVEFSVQSNHLHLVVEATNTVARSRGLQGLAVRLARGLNAKLGRAGKLLATRFHARILKTPREVRNVLRYVLLNARHHAAERGAKLDRGWFDPYSSAAWFDGWTQALRADGDWKRDLLGLPRPTATATNWLLTTGWRRRGLLRIDEVPG